MVVLPPLNVKAEQGSQSPVNAVVAVPEWPQVDCLPHFAALVEPFHRIRLPLCGTS